MKAQFNFRLCALIFSICIVTSVTCYPASGQKATFQPPATIFEDSFETYDVGSFPSESDWILQYNGAGSQYQKVVESISFSPTNSLQLLGKGVEGGTHMSAVATRSVDLSGSTHSYEVYVLVNQTCLFDSSAVLGFGKSASSGIKRSNEVRFCSNGMITTWVDGGEKCGTPLQPYSPDTWYKIYVELDAVSNTYSIWINDEFKGSDFNARIPSDEIEFFSLSSNYGNTKAYFDNVTVSSEGGGEGTSILVDPEQTELGVGETFTTKVHILNVENLYGLDIRVGWNTTLLDYVNHTVAIPVESHSDGILHEPVAAFKNEVNHTSGTYWIAYTSLSPAEPFDGSGVLVEITFQTISYGSCDLTILTSELADFDGIPISHTVTYASIVIHDFHDIAITDLTVGKKIIGEGYCTNVSVSVANRGTFSEDFNVIIYANGTTISETSTTLIAGGSDIIGFVWNTTGWSKGHYLLGASVPPVLNETNIFDNSCTDDFVFLTIPGDIDGDRDIDIFDAVAIARTYGSCTDDLQYDPICDINDDGVIDIFDLVIAVGKYGQDW